MLNLTLKYIIKRIPKFYLDLPRKNSIIIFDDIEKKIVTSFIKNKNIYFIKARGNYYNIFALIYASVFFYRSNFKIEYLNFFFVYSNSNLLLTTSFKRLIIYTFKNHYPSKKIAVFQNGLFGKQFTNLIKNSHYTNLKCDYFFCFSNSEIDVLKKYISTKFVIIGSIRSNFYSIKKNKKKNQIVYISQYRKNLLKNNDFSNLYFTEKKLLPLLINFCNKNNILLKILPGENNYNEELLYYKKILRTKRFILLKRDLGSSYYVCDESIMNVGIDSTLVFESLSRGNKTAFFYFDHKRPDKYDLSEISKYFFNQKKNKFFLKGYNENKINKILHYVYFCNKQVWKKNNLNKILSVPYNKQNKKIVDIIENL